MRKNIRRTAVPAAVVSLALGLILSCEKDQEPVLPRLSDGEGLPYRSDLFVVKRPSDRPYPDRLGLDLYAYYIDGPGRHVRQLTEHRFEKAWVFTEEKGAACLEGRWGYLDRSGDFVIAPQFEWAEPFSEGAAAVKHLGRYGYVDHAGDFMIEPRFLNARFFARGLAPVLTEDGWVYIDQTGATIIPGPYEQAESFSFVVDRAAVKSGGKWGFIDMEGKMVVPPRYDSAGSFFMMGLSPRAPVKTGDDWIYIDSGGR